MGVIKSNRMAVSSLRKQTIMRLLQLMVCSAAIAISFVARAQQIEQEPVPINMGDIMYGGHPIFQGYWHNLCGAVGYHGGTAACLQLTEVPSYYNVVAVAYMKSSKELEIPTFNLNPSTGMTEQNFLQQVQLLNSQGRFVILSLGGPDSKIALTITQGQRLMHEIIRLVWTYGFNGLTLDLEGPAIYAGSNGYVIPQALKAVKSHFAARRTYFSISASPEVIYLHVYRDSDGLRISATLYQKYLSGLNCDWISPQFFDLDDDWEMMGFGLSDTYDFLYRTSKGIVSDTDFTTRRIGDWYQIPSDKMVLGIPTNYDAAKYVGIDVWNRHVLTVAFHDLSEEGYPLRGIMASSINWDVGVNRYGESYNASFGKRYFPLIFPS